MTASLLQASDIVQVYGAGELAVPVLHGVSLNVAMATLTLIMGPSGSGKTTLISVLAGLMKPTGGRVVLCGSPISELTESEIAAVRRRHVAFIFQTYNLFPSLTALDNVALAARMKNRLGWRAARLRARPVLEQVGLGSRVNHRPGQLSGGEKQRVAIARAIVTEPSLIIGDEVTAALDGSTAQEIMTLLRARATTGSAVLLVTHDARLESFADTVVDMEDGRIRRTRSLTSISPQAET